MSSLVAALLRQQQELSAVEQFARWHDQSPPEQHARYAEPLPISELTPGRQLAFEVDLDACTACKACVTACHQLNELDEGELWRKVGLLHGGTAAAPVQLTVTASCHHCLEPACMRGCPAKAYEKDPITGIVHHLDDQCIGCQYCTLTCPYDVPVFNARRGIVRKCDMCASRLGRGEDPACVQGCPNDAIAIRVVDVDHVIEECEAGALVPAAPAAYQTYSTTRYVSERPMPRNVLPADYYQVKPQRSHPSLVTFLVLSQLAVGVFVLASLLAVPALAIYLGAAAAVAGVGASLFHLGRPFHAYRAMAGLRTSWLSREALAFGLFAGAAVGCASLTALDAGHPLLHLFAIAAAVFGVAGVICSALVYAATARPLWRAPMTLTRFAATSAALAAATVMATGGPFGWPAVVIAVAVTVELGLDLSVLVHLGDRHRSLLRRSAGLLAGPLRTLGQARLVLSMAGVLLPVLIGVAAAPVAAGFLLVSALLARHLFFVAVSAPRMPGSITG